jgi:hypothetical protein
LPASSVPPYRRHSGFRNRTRNRENFSDNDNDGFLPVAGLTDILFSPFDRSKFLFCIRFDPPGA